MSEKSLFLPGETASSPAMRDLQSTVNGGMAGEYRPYTQVSPDPDAADGSLDIIGIKKIGGPGGLHMTVCPLTYTGAWNECRLSLTQNEYKAKMQLTRITNYVFEHEFPNFISGTGRYAVTVWKLENTTGSEWIEVNSSEYTVDHLNGRVTFTDPQSSDFDYYAECYFLLHHLVERSTSKRTWALIGRTEEERPGMDGYLAFHVLNPHFELWNGDSDVQGWTKVGNGTIAKVSGFMGNACKFTSPANGETYIYQDVDADGYQQLTFVVFLKTRGNFTIGIDNGAGFTKREVTVLSTSVTYDKYILVTVTSPIDETPTNVRLAIWPQKATSDVSEIQIEAVELIQGAL